MSEQERVYAGLDAVFKWEILDDVRDGFGFQGLWEPLEALRWYLKQSDEAERQAVARQALRELHEDGLIYFFRASESGNPADACRDPAFRLRADQVDVVLSDPQWRDTDVLPLGHPNIWWSATAKGSDAARHRRGERYRDQYFWNMDPDQMVCDRCQERQATVKFWVHGAALYLLRFADQHGLQLRKRDELEGSDQANEQRICFVCAGCAEAVGFQKMHALFGHTDFRRLDFAFEDDPPEGGEGQDGSGVREPRRPRPSGSASEIAVDPESEPRT